MRWEPLFVAGLLALYLLWPLVNDWWDVRRLTKRGRAVYRAVLREERKRAAQARALGYEETTR